MHCIHIEIEGRPPMVINLDMVCVISSDHAEGIIVGMANGEKVHIPRRDVAADFMAEYKVHRTAYAIKTYKRGSYKERDVE